MRMQISSNDKTLWVNIKKSDPTALTQLFQRYYFYLVKIGISYVKDPDLAKDAANDVFFNIWRNRETLSDVENINAYLKTSYRNHIFLLAKRDLKDTDRLKEWHKDQQKPQHSYEEILIALQIKQEEKEKLLRCLEELTPRQKEYLKLKFYEGLSYEQIAEQTGQVVKTIYNTVYEAIKVLRQKISLKK
jgi:RNA polymerase sigma factor (sigma-70 family)